MSDPFGLMGSGINRTSLLEDKIPAWFSEMRRKLSERWETVEQCRTNGTLAEKLEEMLCESFSEDEAEVWYKDARQDQEWRILLLDKNTDEGKLYRAYVGFGSRSEVTSIPTQ